MSSALKAKVSPDWYSSTLRRLNDVQASESEYEGAEDFFPPPQVFTATREFIEQLADSVDESVNLEEPKVFVSPNGQLVLTWGTAQRATLDVRVSARGASFLLKSADTTKKGNNTKD